MRTIRLSCVVLALTSLFCLSTAMAASYATIPAGTVSGTWSGGTTYYVSGSIDVTEGNTLTVEAGAIIKFAVNTKLTVYGTLDVNGSSESLVTITSMNDDSIGDEISGSTHSPSPGDWYGIAMVKSGTAPGIGNFDYCWVGYGGENGSYASIANVHFYWSESGSFNHSISEHSIYYGIRITDCSPAIQNSTIRNCGASGIYSEGTNAPVITNNTFADNAGYGVSLTGATCTAYSGNTGSGNTYNGLMLDLCTVDADISFSTSSGFPLIIKRDLTVNNGKTLTIPAGTIIKGQSDGRILVKGTLDVNGEEGSEVIFTSLTDDTHGGDTYPAGGSPAAGDWVGIQMVHGASDQGIGYLDYCLVRYAGSTDYYGANTNISFSGSTAGNFTNSISEYSEGYGIRVTDCAPTVSASTFRNNAGSGLLSEGSASATIISNNSFNSNTEFGAYIKDGIATAYSGNTGSGNGTNSMAVRLLTVSSDVAWSATSGFPIQIYGNNSIVNENCTLTFSAGLLRIDDEMTLAGAGNFTLSGGATLESRLVGSVWGPAESITISGTRTFDPGANYILSAAGAQGTGSHFPTLVNDLTINNSDYVTLSNDLTVNGTLTLTSGNLKTDANTLTIGTSASSLGAISRTSGTIVGNLKRWFAASTVDDVLFPVGTADHYRPMSLSFSSAPSTGGTLTATFTSGDPGTNGVDLSSSPLSDGYYKVSSLYTDGQWTLTSADGLSGGTYALDATATGFSGVSDYSQLHVLKRANTSSNWTADGTHSAGTGSNAIPEVHRSGLTSFSEFGIGDGTGSQASDIVYSSVQSDQLTLSWSRGNGDNCAVFVYAGSSGSAEPENNTSYTANAAFQTGTQIGSTGWYCVYNGSGTSVTVTGLSAGTMYRSMVCEYNGSSGSEQYNPTTATDNPANQATPSPQATYINFSDVTPNEMTVNWTRGTGSNCIVLIKQTTSGAPAISNNTTYTADSRYGRGQETGAGWYCVYNGSGTSVTVSELASGYAYRVMVCEYTGSSGSEAYVTSSANVNPSDQNTSGRATTAYVSTVAAYSSQYSSSSYSASKTIGAPNVYPEFGDRSEAWAPSSQSSTSEYIELDYSTSGLITSVNIFETYKPGATTAIKLWDGSDWVSVWSGTGSTQGSGSRIFSPAIAVQDFTTNKIRIETNPSTVTSWYEIDAVRIEFMGQASGIIFSDVQTTQMSFSWNQGEGSQRAVFVAQTETGSPTLSTNTTYTANAQFGSGSQIGSSGWYCVYNGTGNSTTVTGLTEGNLYRVMVCEYVGSAGSEIYTTEETWNNPANSNAGPAPVSLTASSGTASANYQNLKGAFDKINSGIHQGDIVILLNSNVSETSSALLNASGSGSASYSSVLIRPAVEDVTVSGAVSTLIYLNGADNVTIDGRINGTGSTKNLTFHNTSTPDGDNRIVFFNGDACENTIQYVTMRGSITSNSASSITNGLIEFAGGSSTGNDNNTIDHCDIDGEGSTSCLIYSRNPSGSTPNNSSNTISNCNLQDFFVVNFTESAAICIDWWGNGSWTITGNSIFQTATRTYHTNANTSNYGIYVDADGACTITNNYIGGSAPQCGGSAYTHSGGRGGFFPIRISGVSVSDPTLIDGNVIQNIYVYVSNNPDNYTYFNGISCASGKIIIGADEGNLIGSAIQTNSIQLYSQWSGTIYGISVGSINSLPATITRNTIGGFRLGTGTFYGINSGNNHAGPHQITHNVIGSASQANSIDVPGSSNISFYGIYSTNTGITHLDSNIVANITNETTSWYANLIRGIYINNAGGTVKGNIIRDVNHTYGSESSGDNNALTGIYAAYSNNPNNVSISRNSIHGFHNTNASISVETNGIYYKNTGTGCIIEKNCIYDLTHATSSTSSTINGIWIANGPVTVANNMISLGSGVSTALNLRGIAKTTTSANTICYNTVRIGGTVTLPAGSTYSQAFYRGATAADIISDNIFANFRTNDGSTQKHFAVNLNATTSISADYNLLYAEDGYVGTSDNGSVGDNTYTALGDWQSGVSLDEHSISADPLLHSLNAPYLVPNSPVSNMGSPVSGLTTDFVGNTRDESTPDIGAYEFSSNSVTTSGSITNPEMSTDNVLVAPGAAGGVTVNPTSTLSGRMSGYFFDAGRSGTAPEGYANLSPYYWVLSSDLSSFETSARFYFNNISSNGVGDPNTLVLVKREHAGADWVVYANVTRTSTYIQANGLTSFSEFALSGNADNSLPVVLSAFEALSDSRGVFLSWTTESELENLGFILEKRLKTSSDWTELVSFRTEPALAGQGSSSESNEYEYTDTSVKSGETYFYRLGDVDYQGKLTWHAAVEVLVQNGRAIYPDGYDLQHVYPNPFNAAFTLGFSLSESMTVSAQVYDVRGRQVLSILDDALNPGTYHFNVATGNLGSGVYLLKIQLNENMHTQKIILLK